MVETSPWHDEAQIMSLKILSLEMSLKKPLEGFKVDREEVKNKLSVSHCKAEVTTRVAELSIFRSRYATRPVSALGS